MKRESKKSQGSRPSGVRLPTHEEIAARAYQIYLERGCQHGHDLDDWLQAEYELLQMPLEQLARLTPPKATQSSGSQRSVIEVVRSVL